MGNSLNYLGIARKAHKLEIGEEFTGIAARTKKARIIILASDASENAARKARNLAQTNDIPLIELNATRDDLGELLDRSRPAMMAITDAGIAAAFVNRLKDEMPEYAELAEKLDAKAKKIDRRRGKTRKGAKSAKRSKGGNSYEHID